jgi:hypothetical protein
MRHSYNVMITTPDEEGYVIGDPISCSISVNRNSGSSLNTASVDLYNLSESNRNTIRKDKNKTNEYWGARVLAGYDGEVYTIFIGNMQEAYTEKKGLDWVTHIEAYDGLYSLQNTRLEITLNEDVNIPEYLKNVIKEKHLASGNLEVIDEKSGKRGVVLEGAMQDVLKETFGNNWFIDNEHLYVMKPGAVLTDYAYLVTSDNLLSSPRKRDTLIDIDVIFTPKLSVGRIVNLRSMYEQYNGEYQVIGFTHDFEYMGGSSRTARTTINMQAPFANITGKRTVV